MQSVDIPQVGLLAVSEDCAKDAHDEKETSSKITDAKRLDTTKVGRFCIWH